MRENNGWRYIGHVGTGFSHKTLEELHGKLMKLKIREVSFPAKVKDEAVTTWVKPSLVAEVKFTEWTSSGEMRHPVYLGLRADKRAEDVVHKRETPAANDGTQAALQQRVGPPLCPSLSAPHGFELASHRPAKDVAGPWPHSRVRASRRRVPRLVVRMTGMALGCMGATTALGLCGQKSKYEIRTGDRASFQTRWPRN